MHKRMFLSSLPGLCHFYTIKIPSVETLGYYQNKLALRSVAAGALSPASGRAITTGSGSARMRITIILSFDLRTAARRGQAAMAA